MAGNPKAVKGRRVLNPQGEAVGVVKKRVGKGYVEIEREGPSWFVPLELLETRGEELLLAFSSRLTELERTVDESQ